MRSKLQLFVFMGIMTLSLSSFAAQTGQKPEPEQKPGQALEKDQDLAATLELIQHNLNNPEKLAQLLPIVSHPIKTSNYEQILMTQLRDRNTDMKSFRHVSRKIGDLLVNKVVESLPLKSKDIQTPVSKFKGAELAGTIELVSIMRSGDAILDSFMRHFPKANVSKILVQRDEKTAKPNFNYMKLTPSIASGAAVIITEPMIATGGTLDMVIALLKEKGVKEENIIVAAICVAPEGLLYLNQKFPKIKVAMTVLDEHLNAKKYIVPGLGDFGDRYYGTT